MKTLTYSLGKIYAPACCLLLCMASSVVASDLLVLQKVPVSPTLASTNRAQLHLSAQATFALVNYSLRDSHAKARALYVSSGSDLTSANSMIDDQPTTSFGFALDDKSPTALIDLGKVSTVRRLSAIYSARPGSIDFYVMQSLPELNAEESNSDVKIDSNELASLKPVGTAVDDGTQGRATIDFPATKGRYVMLRWVPAAHEDAAFTVAEITAEGPLLAASGRYFNNQPQSTSERTVAADSKDVPESKDVKDIAEAPAEGPPPLFPEVPPFTFVPQLVPVSE